jgi:hypothetical protein
VQFAASKKLAPGETGLGFVVFQVPDSARIAEVQV